MEKIFKDSEMIWFYIIELGVIAIVFFIGLISPDGVWYLNLGVIVIWLGFLIFGPPLNAVVSSNSIKFKGPVRRTTITPKSLARVNIIGAHDYRAHISLRNKFSFPVMYRCRQYSDPSALAQTILNLISQAPQAKVDQQAIKLLEQVAKGNARPLPLAKKA